MYDYRMIRLEHIEKSYGKQMVLRDIHFEIALGEFVAIEGRSGSGKSTLLNLIGGMDKPDQGHILFSGEDITAYSDYQLTLYRRKKIGFIFQFFNLLPHITVFENISMPLLLNSTEDAQKVHEFIHLVGLAGREYAYPFQLSGGEQQRVAVARALVHNPEIILADEPTGSLDSETGSSIMHLIDNLVKHMNKTIILVTHEHYVAGYAQRIVHIHDGLIL